MDNNNGGYGGEFSKNGFSANEFSGSGGADGQSSYGGGAGQSSYGGIGGEREKYTYGKPESDANAQYVMFTEQSPSGDDIPYPAMISRSGNSKKKKPPTRKTLAVFGIITLILCMVVSAVSGTISSFVAVQVIKNKDNSANTTVRNSDELISVPTETDSEMPINAVESGPTVTEAQTESTTQQNAESSKTKGEVYAESVNSIVGIKCEGTKEVSTLFGRTAKAQFTSTGSGFFITSDGYIVTNYHVIENATKITVTTYAGQAYEATVRGYEASNDIAVIKVTGEFTPVKEGDSSSLSVGDEILVIGNALGELSYTFTDGMVSYLNRAITTENGDVINMYQTNAAINEGNSGGPVYDMQGRAVGIASAKYESSSIEGLGFFIPLNDVKSMISDIIENGYVSGKPSIGVSVQPVTQTMAMRYSIPVGLYIVAVGSDTAAANAGLKAADVITGIDGETVTGAAELSSALSSKRAGDTLNVTVSRSGKYLTFTLTLDEYKPADPRTEYSGVYDY